MKKKGEKEEKGERSGATEPTSLHVDSQRREKGRRLPCEEFAGGGGKGGEEKGGGKRPRRETNDEHYFLHKKRGRSICIRYGSGPFWQKRGKGKGKAQEPQLLFRSL